jgi:hypothetical protein
MTNLRARRQEFVPTSKHMDVGIDELLYPMCNGSFFFHTFCNHMKCGYEGANNIHDLKYQVQVHIQRSHQNINTIFLLSFYQWLLLELSVR